VTFPVENNARNLPLMQWNVFVKKHSHIFTCFSLHLCVYKKFSLILFVSTNNIQQNLLELSIKKLIISNLLFMFFGPHNSNFHNYHKVILENVCFDQVESIKLFQCSKGKVDYLTLTNVSRTIQMHLISLF
jgi:hypothetical protein